MKKTFLSLFLALSIALFSIPAFAAQDSDIKYNDISGHWAKTAILEYGYTDVFALKDGKFNPGRQITRGEFVRMLHKALDIKIKYIKAPDITEFFNDVNNEEPGSADLYDLVSVGIIDRKGSFKLSSTLPRDEMVHYIINALKDVTGGNYAVIKMMPAPFGDDNEITAAYKNDIIEAVLLKIVYGSGNNMFYPKAAASRAEAVTFIQRLMTTIDKFKVKAEIKPSFEMNSSGLTMKVSITNVSDKPIVFNHSSGQKFDFTLLDSNGKELYRWSDGRFFTMMLTSTTIEAGKTVEFSELLEQGTFGGIKDRVKYMKAYIVGNSDDFGINPDGYLIEVN